MRMRVFSLLVLAASLCCLIRFFPAFTVVADTVPSGGHYLGVNDTRALIGDSIPFTYYNGQNYVDSTATYLDSVSSISETSEAPAGFVSGVTYLRYSYNASGINSSPNFIQFRILPTYSIYDTEFLYTCFALSRVTNLSISPSAYQSPNSDWYVAGSNINFANNNQSAAGAGNFAYLTFSGIQALYVPIVHRQQSTFSAYSTDFEASGSIPALGYFYVMCPYVSGDAFGQSGTFASSSSGSVSGTTVTTSGGQGGGQSVDLTETNGLLGRIEVILSGIVDGIKGLFIPDDEFLSDWVDDMKQLLEDHLGGLYQAVTMSITFMQQFPNAVAKQSITIPACSVPLAGSTFTLGPYIVPLKVDGLPAALYDGIAYIIDFLASMAFLKMCRNKLEIFLNPDSEVVQSDN